MCILRVLPRTLTHAVLPNTVSIIYIQSQYIMQMWAYFFYVMQSETRFWSKSGVVDGCMKLELSVF